MGLLTSNEQGRPFLLNHSIYSKHRHPPLLSRSQETLEVCLSQGSSYESHTGGLDSRRLCGPGGYLSWTRCDKRSLRLAARRSPHDVFVRVIAEEMVALRADHCVRIVRRRVED